MDNITDIHAEVNLQCTKCSQGLQSGEKFCGYCGQEVEIGEVPVQEDAFEVIKPTLLYYFVTLILLSVYKLTEAFPEGIEGQLVISVVDILIVLAFWTYFFRPLAPLFSLKNLQLKILFLTLIGTVASALFVTKAADLINISLFDDVYYSPYLFEDTSNPFIWAVVMSCICPAIFEEVAFRGFMFTNLQVISSAQGAVYISAVLFGIMHLSFISLIWLIPLGIVFAIMRLKYNTLWYGIIGHFTYNFTITVIEFYS